MIHEVTAACCLFLPIEPSDHVTWQSTLQSCERNISQLIQLGNVNDLQTVDQELSEYYDEKSGPQ